MVQAKGTSQGAFFDTKDMRPLIDNEAFLAALKFLKESGNHGRRTNSTSMSATRGRYSSPANARSTSIGATSASWRSIRRALK
jgi:hypothetical protein